MKLTVLCDNNSIIDNYLLAEPALSFLLEDGSDVILFDTGYSDVFVRNAEKMGIDLNGITKIVFSHGHNDHTKGVENILNLKQKIEVIAHPDVDKDKFYEGLDVSMPVKLKDFPGNFRITTTTEPLKISENIWFLGEIKRTVQEVKPLGEDYLYDDSALLYIGDNKISIITGCSHSGICNIIEQAKRVSGISEIDVIIGGFHLLNNPKLNNEVCNYLSKENVAVVYPCHCTDLQAKIQLSKVSEIKEVGVGLIIDF
ncbi:MAG: MBL fold metallo-hydrolase [Erysipelotrichaceae bacterium]|jgi:7,8-dihydropterin-6-yl-methyl-4-(beta-D-ribofuranosyl)aminobenzene 5'-phosphate synthase